MDYQHYLQKGYDIIIHYLPQVVSALLILIIGMWLIKLFSRLFKNLLVKRAVDESVAKFLQDLMKWGLNILLFIVVISKLGVQTASFVAVIGAAGLAIGMALQGSLANFAGGVLILIFKPFKIGDYVNAQGTFGTVKEITIFTTTLKTDRNQLAIIPNGQLSNEKIINYSVLGKRLEVLKFTIHPLDDIKKAKETLLQLAKNHDKIIQDNNPSGPAIVVAEAAGSGTVLQLSYWTKTSNYWRVHFEMIEKAKYALDEAGMNQFVPVQEVRLKKEG